MLVVVVGEISPWAIRLFGRMLTADGDRVGEEQRGHREQAREKPDETDRDQKALVTWPRPKWMYDGVIAARSQEQDKAININKSGVKCGPCSPPNKLFLV